MHLNPSSGMLFTALLLLELSCSAVVFGQESAELTAQGSAVAPIDAGQDAVSEQIRGRIEQLMFSGSLNLNGVPVLTGEILTQLYTLRDFRRLWPDNMMITQLEELSDFAFRNGLDPTDYPLPAIRELLTSARPFSAEELADLDILATETLIRIGYQLRFGKVNPEGLFSDWNFRRELVSGVTVTATIEELVAAESLVNAVAERMPRGVLYQLLQDALARYRQIQRSGGWPVVADGVTLRAGDTDARIPIIRRRLSVTGDLADSEPGSDHFDAPLADAVRRFQFRHGLQADGVIGARTLRAMNVSVAVRIDQLRASLERGRWVEDESRAAGERLLLVNIASAQLALMDAGRPVFVTRVQVGKPYRQTPVFAGELQYLVFNPTWTVPPTILRQDVLPKLKAGADEYLSSSHMDLLDHNGAKIDPGTVDFSQISTTSFPYILRQRPGSWNALGQVKFIFPNSHFVFLHDTPARELFERADRAFSSGCIRVEHPFELAELVLNEARWNMPAFQAVLDTQQETVVHLAEPLPVFLLYWTGMADPDGTVRFYEDIYGRDQILLKAMAAAPTLSIGETISTRDES